MEKDLLLAIREMLKEELEPVKNKLDETYEIVKALEHASQVNKSEHDRMQNDISHIKGDMEMIKKDMYRVEEATANNWAEIARLKKSNHN